MWTGQRCMVKVWFWTGRRRRQCSSIEGGEEESVVLDRIVEDTVKLSLKPGMQAMLVGLEKYKIGETHCAYEYG